MVNFVAMTSHKLMGDTFVKLATSISETDSSYALWMTSQVFVIVSRVKQLKNLTFVGDKSATLNAIKALFEQRDFREERMFGLLDKIRNNKVSESSSNKHFSHVFRSIHQTHTSKTFRFRGPFSQRHSEVTKYVLCRTN